MFFYDYSCSKLHSITTQDKTVILKIWNEILTTWIVSLSSFQFPDPKQIQINVTGFLNAKNSRIFMAELWTLLTSAMENEMGIPEEFVEAKKKELRKQQVKYNL